MKKITKALAVILLAVIICMTGVNALAIEDQNSRLSHTSGGAFSFSALASGGHVDVSYEAYSDTFVKATLTVKLEKRFLWVFWNEIDTWSATCTDLWGDFYHVFELDGKGTYRAVMTLEVYGIDGTIDVIPYTIECEYK